ncbi:MAG: hypothetical protein E7372_03760 [Clostridiales bacterium]|nr:hypothetical protein [Clostridiales bacterium]
MKTKSIKTLVASLMAIVVCFAMLLGTTFAWFTDSIASNNNIISSGNLDVNAYWMEGNQDPTDENNWIEFDGSPIFNYSNWEPGYVEAKHIKISNEGTLAFKYNLAIVPNGPVGELANVIDVYFINQAQAITRNSITNATKVGTLADLISDPDGAAYGILLPKNTTPNNAKMEIVESVSVSIAFKMQEDAGNDYFGLSIGTTFDIVISATQYNFEEDTFGNQYDENVFVADYYVANADSLIEAIKNSGNNDVIGLTSDIKIDPASMSNAYGTTGINITNLQTIDGNGNTLDIKGAGGTWDSGINTTGGTIKNIKITGSFRGVFINHNSSVSGRVVLENVIIDGTTYTISCDQGMYQGLTAKNSTFMGWTSYAATLGDAEFYNCIFGEGNGYAYCRPYAPTRFVNCNFEEGFQIDARANVSFENCTLNGVKLNAQNISTLVTSNLSNVVKVK